ncbi:MAG TPA: hypothetical protein VFS05_13775 [Gemmatimonadaceae bacterium]|nr:hypothetical protein [Gemmatimonadaceae bacterium]
MRSSAIARWVVRVTGPALVVLGLLFWAGRALALLPLHMALGMLFVLALWALAAIAARAGLHRGMVAAAAAWGIVVPLFGIAQTRLLPGPAHWVVRLAHLLIGIIAMIVADRLARFIRANLRPPRAPSAAESPASAARRSIATP